MDLQMSDASTEMEEENDDRDESLQADKILEIKKCI